MLLEQAIYKDFDTNVYNLYILEQRVNEIMKRFLGFLVGRSDILPKVKDNGDKSWFVEVKTKDNKTLHYTIFQSDHDGEYNFEYIIDDTRHNSYLAWIDFLNLINPN